jgi:HTH-type transcriptional regulator, sugar sensing transcriptional regulator
MKSSRLLQDFGFDEKTEKVYRSLLALADAPASSVAKDSGVKRTSVYHILENLIRDGFVSSYINRGTKRYFAENPEKIKTFYQQRMIIAERIIPELLKDINQSRGKVKIRTFEGAEGMRSISYETLAVKEKIIMTIGSSQTLLKYSGGKYAYGARRRQKKIFMRSLRFSEDKTDISLERMQQIKILPKDLKFPGYVHIFDNKIGIVLFEGNGYGFIVESEKFSQIIKSIFEILWSISSTPSQSK